MDLSLEIRKNPRNAAALKAKMLEKLSESERYNLLIYEMIVLGQIERISNHRDFSNSNLSGNNFGTQTGVEIRTSLNLLAEKGADEKKIASILAEISDAVARDTKLSSNQKREAVDHAALLAEEAQRPAEQRNHASVCATLDAIPKILSSSVSLLTLWHNFGPCLTSFFR